MAMTITVAMLRSWPPIRSFTPPSPRQTDSPRLIQFLAQAIAGLRLAFGLLDSPELLRRPMAMPASWTGRDDPGGDTSFLGLATGAVLRQIGRGDAAPCGPGVKEQAK